MLDRQQLRDFCLSRKAALADFPFGPDPEVLKVMGRMFALLPVEADPLVLIVKCDPMLADMLRQTYPAVTATFNKRHWNRVLVDGSIPDDEVLEMIDHSYGLVVKGLKKIDRKRLEEEIT